MGTGGRIDSHSHPPTLPHALLAFPVGHEPLQRHHGYRPTSRRPGACGLARVRADATADAGEGQLAADQLQRLGVLAHADQRYVALDVDAGGAGGTTGGTPRLSMAKAPGTACGKSR